MLVSRRFWRNTHINMYSTYEYEYISPTLDAHNIYSPREPLQGLNKICVLDVKYIQLPFQFSVLSQPSYLSKNTNVVMLSFRGDR